MTLVKIMSVQQEALKFKAKTTSKQTKSRQKPEQMWYKTNKANKERVILQM